MKIAVISDTHLPRFRSREERALEMLAAEEPDLILHCGDITEPGALVRFERIAPLDAVAGNNDGADLERRYGRVKIVRAGAWRIGLVHGDGARGTTLARARAAFAHAAVDAIAFGHSHVPLLQRDGALWIVNPGSMTDKRRQARYSFAVIEPDRAGAPCPRLVFFDAAP